MEHSTSLAEKGTREYICVVADTAMDSAKSRRQGSPPALSWSREMEMNLGLRAVLTSFAVATFLVSCGGGSSDDPLGIGLCTDECAAEGETRCLSPNAQECRRRPGPAGCLEWENVFCARNEVCEPSTGRCEETAEPTPSPMPTPPACKDNCGGCCAGSRCETGTVDFACGKHGDACVECTAPDMCNSGECSIAPSSRWAMAIASAIVNENAVTEDGDGSAPDVRVCATVAGDRLCTAIAENTYMPLWNQIVATATARDFAAGVEFEFVDSDTFVDDAFGTCGVVVGNDDLRAGAVTLDTSECTAQNVATVVLSFAKQP